MQNKEDTKTVALGTSKINYLDPWITVAWCKRHEVPIEKVRSNISLFVYVLFLLLYIFFHLFLVRLLLVQIAVALDHNLISPFKLMINFL